MSLENLKRGNKQFQTEFTANLKLYKDLVKNGQHPKVLWVGCSDSRVVPEFTVNANAGDLFVIRNIANIIPPADAKESCTDSILEYAVLHLHVKHIIICGHTGCGGMNAVVDGTPENTQIHNWLKHACQPDHDASHADREDLVLETIKANVMLQAEHLLTFKFIKQRVEQEKLQIHKWLYDMNSGGISYFENSTENWVSINQI